MALVNLLSASERFDTLPKTWQDTLWSWLGSRQLMQLRNSSLYTRFDMEGHLTTPDENVSPEQAALLVYAAGFVGVELDQFVTVEPEWVLYIGQSAESFRTRHLR